MTPDTPAMDEKETALIEKYAASMYGRMVGIPDYVIRQQFSEFAADLSFLKASQEAEVVKALREVRTLLYDLRQGQSIHNERFPDRKVEGTLWDRVPDVIKRVEACLATPQPSPDSDGDAV